MRNLPPERRSSSAAAFLCGAGTPGALARLRRRLGVGYGARLRGPAGRLAVGIGAGRLAIAIGAARELCERLVALLQRLLRSEERKHHEIDEVRGQLRDLGGGAVQDLPGDQLVGAAENRGRRAARDVVGGFGATGV